MIRRLLRLVRALVFGLPFLPGCSASPIAPTLAGSSEPRPPIAKRIPTELKKHGDVRVDPYFWLRERDQPAVLDYLRAENRYTDAMMAGTEALQTDLLGELRARIKPDDSTFPQKDGEYFYYTRYERGKEYPIFCRRKGSVDGPEQILLDGNEAARGHDFLGIGKVKTSPDGNQLAFALDFIGRRFFKIYFKDLRTGKTSENVVFDVTSNFEWLNDNSSVVYIRQDPSTLRADRAFLHRVEDGSPDSLLYEEKDTTFELTLQKSLSRKFIQLGSRSTLTDEWRTLDAENPSGGFRVFAKRRHGVEYSIEDGADRFFIQTNYRAKNFRLMEARYGKTELGDWKPLIPHRADTLISGFVVFKDHIALRERKDGLTQIEVFDRKKGKGSFIRQREEAYVVSIDSQREYDSPWFRFRYESPRMPALTIEYALATGEQVVRKAQDVPTYDPALYETSRLFVPTQDGKRVPLTLVHRKGLALTPKTPMLLYGYGAYGQSTEPAFVPHWVSLLDRGFVAVTVHVRGGSEMGRWWYEEGRQQKKKNTFLDFVAATEFLHANGISSPTHTYAIGRSAGGLLMGAIVNLRPDLYRGVLAGMPFVDVLTTELDDTIPLTTGEYDEWGNPNHKADYKYIKSYSPYDNVKAQPYPGMLVWGSFHDSQVQYWEPAKWVAKLRSLKTDANPLLLITNLEGGHGGKSGRFNVLRDVAIQYAFILKLEKTGPLGWRRGGRDGP